MNGKHSCNTQRECQRLTKTSQETNLSILNINWSSLGGMLLACLALLVAYNMVRKSLWNGRVRLWSWLLQCIDIQKIWRKAKPNRPQTNPPNIEMIDNHAFYSRSIVSQCGQPQRESSRSSPSSPSTPARGQHIKLAGWRQLTPSQEEVDAYQLLRPPTAKLPSQSWTYQTLILSKS